MAFDVLSFLIGRQTAKGSGGGSSGGGSFPKGVYFEAVNMPFVNNFFQQWFELNGELYCMTLPYLFAGSDIVTYKYVNGAWTEIIAKTNFVMLSPNRWNFIEHNGKMYMFGGGSACYLVFDGTSITKITENVPGELSRYNVCMCNEKLFVYCEDTGTLYHLDLNTNTWTEEMKLASNTTTSYYIFSVNGKLYGFLNYEVYHIDVENSQIIKIGRLQHSFGNNIMIKTEGNCLYYLAGQGNNKKAAYINKYNVEDNTEEFVGYVLTALYDVYSPPFQMDGKMHMLYGNNGEDDEIMLLKPYIIE